MMSRLKTLCRREDGVTAVEFAFIAPVMLMLIGGLLEVGYLTFARSTLENAVLTAARQSRVSDCPNENAEAIEEGIAERMSFVVSSDGEPPDVRVDSYGGNFGDVGNPEPFDDVNGSGQRDEGESYTDVNGNGEWDADMGSEGDFGSFGEVVRFTATFKVKSLVPAVSRQINSGRDYYTIESVTVVRNEPFREAACAL